MVLCRTQHRSLGSHEAIQIACMIFSDLKRGGICPIMDLSYLTMDPLPFHLLCITYVMRAVNKLFITIDLLWDTGNFSTFTSVLCSFHLVSFDTQGVHKASEPLQCQCVCILFYLDNWLLGGKFQQQAKTQRYRSHVDAL